MGIVKIELKMGLSAITMIAATLAVTPALAQDAATDDAIQSPQTDNRGGSAEVGDIVVTARKLEETVKDVPLTVNALNSAQLESRRIQSLVDLTRFTSGVNFNLGTSRASGSISVRGMTQVSGVGDNRRDLVTVFIDGVPYVGPPAGIGLEGGIERVEVIKGPQSALFGRATFGGAISIITQTPGNEFTGRISATAATYDDYRLSGNISVPIVRDVLSLGLVGSFSRFGGFYKNALGGRLGESDRNFGSATVSFTPTSNLKIKAYYSRRRDHDGEAASYLIGRFPTHNCGPFPGFQTRSLIGLPASITTVGAARRAYCGPLRAGNGPFGINTTIPAASTGLIPLTEHGLYIRHDLGTLQGNWDFLDGFGLAATVSKQRQQFQGVFDFERTPEDRYQIYANNIQRQKFYEARLTSPADKRITAMVGVSRVDQEYDSVGAFINGSLFGARAGGPPSTRLDRNGQKNDAVFGSASFDIIRDQLSLIGELRYQKETLTSGVGTPGVLAVETTATLPRIILRYRPTDETTIYLNYAKGTQPSQGYAPFFLLSPAQRTIAASAGVVGVLPEATVTNYEIGFKHYSDDRRWFINVAAFYNEWVGRQGVRTVQADTNGNGIIDLTAIGANREVFNAVPFAAGDSNTRGIEVELGYRPVPALALGGNIAWAHTNITKSLNEALYLRFFGNGDASGAKFPNAPKISGSAFAEYTGELSGTSEWFARGDVTYLGKVYDSILNFAYVPGQWKVNLRGGYRTGPFEIAAFVNNLFDDRTLESARYNSDSAADPNFFQLSASEATLPRKRQVGVTVSARF